MEYSAPSGTDDLMYELFKLYIDGLASVEINSASTLISEFSFAFAPVGDYSFKKRPEIVDNRIPIDSLS